MTVRFPGVYAAAATPFAGDGSLAWEQFAAHCRWLADRGAAGIVPNGSLGEYETMDDVERARTVEVAITAAGADCQVVPGVSGKSGYEARRWAEQAADAGCPAVMCLPPTSHAPTPDEVVEHFREVAKAGLPIIVYNNPFSTRVDLTPTLLRRLDDEVEQVVAVKEFSQDVRRIAAIGDLAPNVEVLCGCDDLVLESILMGATGWIAGFVNAFPTESVHLFELGASGNWDEARRLYRLLLPLLRWDADPRFVQAVKLAQDEVGRYGGPVRLPRRPLPHDDAAAVIESCQRLIHGVS